MTSPGARPKARRHGVAMIVAASVIAVGWGCMAHEAAHVVAGVLAGGSPTLLTGTEVLGDFRSLSPAGYVALGISGSLVNLLFAGLGWWLLRRGPRTAGQQLMAWFFFAVNGMLLTTKMMGEPLVGWGDWMTVLEPLPATTALRIVVTLVGTAGVAVMVRRSGRALAELLSAVDPARRTLEAIRILMIGAAAGSVLVLGAGVASPQASTRAVLLGLGAGLGPYVALVFGIRFVGRIRPERASLPSGPQWPWLLTATATALGMWLVVGPGIGLS